MYQKFAGTLRAALILAALVVSIYGAWMLRERPETLLVFIVVGYFFIYQVVPRAWRATKAAYHADWKETGRAVRGILIFAFVIASTLTFHGELIEITPDPLNEVLQRIVNVVEDSLAIIPD